MLPLSNITWAIIRSFWPTAAGFEPMAAAPSPTAVEVPLSEIAGSMTYGVGSSASSSRSTRSQSPATRCSSQPTPAGVTGRPSASRIAAAGISSGLTRPSRAKATVPESVRRGVSPGASMCHLQVRGP